MPMTHEFTVYSFRC